MLQVRPERILCYGVDAPQRIASFRPRADPIPQARRRMRRCIWTLVGLTVAAATSLGAQGLRDKISELFIFTAGKDPLFLGGTAHPHNPAVIHLHANHFNPAAPAPHSTLTS